LSEAKNVHETGSIPRNQIRGLVVLLNLPSNYDGHQEMGKKNGSLDKSVNAALLEWNLALPAEKSEEHPV